jgi:hypothetical protein
MSLTTQSSLIPVSCITLCSRFISRWRSRIWLLRYLVRLRSVRTGFGGTRLARNSPASSNWQSHCRCGDPRDLGKAAEHYDEPGLSALVSMAALTNFCNRVNTTLRPSLTPGASRISQDTVPTRRGPHGH